MFSFEHTHQLTQSEYAAIWALADPSPTARYARRLIVTVAGVTCLFWPYTMLLGVAILALGAVGVFAPHFFPGTAARRFRDFHYLDGPVTYGADEEGVWARTPDLSAKAAWRHMTMWRERNGWLILQGNGFPPVLLPIAGLKAQAAYERVRSLAQQHAVEWNSPDARRHKGFSFKSVLGVLVIAGCTSSTAADNTTGQWTLSMDVDLRGNPSPPVDCTFEQKGSELTVKCGTGIEMKGTIRGRVATWGFERTGVPPMTEDRMVVTHTADVNEAGNELKGTWRPARQAFSLSLSEVWKLPQPTPMHAWI